MPREMVYQIGKIGMCKDKYIWFVHNNIDFRATRIGEFVLNTDGYNVFFPDTSRGGYWEEYVLRAIADLLEITNREWDEIVQNDPVLNNAQ